MIEIQAHHRRGEFLLDVGVSIDGPGVIALFGRSGCGKSTLVNIVAGLLRADQARVRIDDAVLEDTRAGVRIPAEQRRIGYVFQDARLFPHLDVLGNLRYGERRAPASSRRITLDAIAPMLGLEPLLGRRVHQLSGGERQRVALARALLSQPRVLLLDEPLASLDAARREEVLPYLETLRDELKLPIVYVSHQFEEVLRLATHVVLLEQGKVVAQGALEQISLHPGLREIVGPDAVGAVVSGTVKDAHASGLSTLQLGDNELHVSLPGAKHSDEVRAQLLARDIILATRPPQGLSVRNVLTGAVARLQADDSHTQLVFVDIGGPIVMARVTNEAASALDLEVGRKVWVLIKAVSIRGRPFAGRAG